MDRVERFRKRQEKLKVIRNTDTAYNNVDEELVQSFLNSEADTTLAKSTFLAMDNHYKFDFDLIVTKEEAKEFLDKFKKDFNQERFDKLIADCKQNVIQSIVTPFGLGNVVSAYDKVGGNVTTTHNFKKGISATSEDTQRYDEWQNSVSKVDRTAHDKKKEEWTKETYKKMKEGDVIYDGYTGKSLGIKINNKTRSESSIHTEHITSVAEIERDPSNHLFARGSIPDQRHKDRATISGNENNLTRIDGGMNSSKRHLDLMEWKEQKVSKEHAKETKNPNMTNQEYYNVDYNLTNEKYKQSKSFIKDEQLKRQVVKQLKEIATTGANEGAKMGMQQAIGVVMTEFFVALFDEIIDIYKNGFKNGFDDEGFFTVLKERVKRIVLRLKDKWKEVAIAFKDGFISGFISNLATTVINMFVTTGKRLVRMIREGIFSLLKAIKILLFPPEDLSFEDAMNEAKKLVLTGVIVGLGVVLEETVEKLIQSMPILTPFGHILSPILVGSVVGLATTMAIYYLDKKKNDKDVIKEMIKQTDEGIERCEVLLKQLTY